MRPLGLGVLLLCLLAVLSICTIVSAEAEVFLCAGPNHMEPVEVAYRGEHELTLCVSPDENATHLNATVSGGPISNGFVYLNYGRGTLPAGEMWVTQDGDGVRLDTECEPDSYVLSITVGYLDDEGERVHLEFPYPIEYRSVLDVRGLVLHKGLGSVSMELVIETFEAVDELNVSLFYLGSPDGQFRERRSTDVAPGVHSFEMMLTGEISASESKEDYGYLIETTIDGHTMTYVDLEFDVDLEVVQDQRSPLMLLSLVVALVSIGVIASVYRLRRRGAKPAEEGADDMASR
jgi:hypothetical protein